MSPRKLVGPSPKTVRDALRRVWVGLGLRLREARQAKRWSIPELARRAGVSRWLVYGVERGHPVSIDALARLGDALRLRLEVDLVDDGQTRQQVAARQADPVHAAMGEFELRHLRPLGHPTALDEPYQHYQFAGRADVAAWDLATRALLHIENRTRFPDFQEMAGSFNAKRAYLGGVLAARLGIRSWRSETHVMAGLWSSEVLSVVKSMKDSFRTICPDPMDAFAAWWAGLPPATGKTAALVILDPFTAGRQRAFGSLEEALGARPRYRGYADVAQLLTRVA